MSPSPWGRSVPGCPKGLPSQHPASQRLSAVPAGICGGNGQGARAQVLCGEASRALTQYRGLHRTHHKEVPIRPLLYLQYSSTNRTVQLLLFSDVSPGRGSQSPRRGSPFLSAQAGQELLSPHPRPHPSSPRSQDFSPRRPLRTPCLYAERQLCNVSRELLGQSSLLFESSAQSWDMLKKL